jgi:hypothetical protein
VRLKTYPRRGIQSFGRSYADTLAYTRVSKDNIKTDLKTGMYGCSQGSIDSSCGLEAGFCGHTDLTVGKLIQNAIYIYIGRFHPFIGHEGP